MIRKIKTTHFVMLICACATYVFGFTTAYNKWFPYVPVVRMTRSIWPARPEASESWVLQAQIFHDAPLQNTITMLGDSLTGFGPWGVLMPRVKIDNRGIPGESSTGLLQRVRRGDPIGKTVTILTGVNDGSAGLSLAKSEDNLATIVSLLKGRRIFVIGTLLTVHEQQNANIRALNQYQKTLCDGVRCHYIDLNTILAPQQILKTNFTIDGVHLNWAGYQAAAPIIENALLTNGG